MSETSSGTVPSAAAAAGGANKTVADARFLRFENLVKEFDSVVAVDKVSIDSGLVACRLHVVRVPEAASRLLHQPVF